MGDVKENEDYHEQFKIKVRITAHAYAEEKIHDEYFDYPEYGIAGCTTMGPLDKARGKDCEYYYDANTTLGDFDHYFMRFIWGDTARSEIFAKMTFIAKNRRFVIDNEEASFLNAVDKYLDTSHLGVIEICYWVSYDAGQIEPKAGKLRYTVHSRERGKHNSPHVHVSDSGYNYEAVVLIDTGEVKEGSLPDKLAREAKRTILGNQRYYYECWNTLTDGLAVDIDHEMGIVE